MDLNGKVHEIGATTNVTDTFKKREIIIEYTENVQYPEFIKMEASQDKVNILDAFKVGDEVKVSFNLRGRPWTDKTGKTSYFNTLAIWKVELLSAAIAQTQPDEPPF